MYRTGGTTHRTETEIRKELEATRERLRQVRAARTELRNLAGEGNLFAGTIEQLDDLEAQYTAQVSILLWVLGET